MKKQKNMISTGTVVGDKAGQKYTDSE